MIRNGPFPSFGLGLGAEQTGGLGMFWRRTSPRVGRIRCPIGRNYTIRPRPTVNLAFVGALSGAN